MSTIPTTNTTSYTEPLFLLLATFIIAICGLVYELLAGTLSSYLLGDSIYQFSIVIGLFMSAMGIGAFLSRYLQQRLEYHFTVIQLSLGLIGGLSAPLLFFAFAWLMNYNAFLFVICLVLGILIGLEIPLITRILQQHQILKINISNVLTADYIGALVAALLFPLVLMPLLGVIGISLLFGLLNVAVAIVMLWLFRDRIHHWGLTSFAALCFLTLSTAMFYSEDLLSFMERRLFQNPIIFAETTPYQRLIITRRGERIQLYINGGLQFDSIDEYRYHEALVHPAMNLAIQHQQVLILGGGDGMAVREILKYPDVQHITLVDLDPRMTQLFRDNPLLTALNQQSLQHPKVQIINQDAWQFIEQSQQMYDVVLIDLPDPHNSSLSKLYSQEFYFRLAQHLSQGGLVVTQATSPLFAHDAYWCIHNTLAATPSPIRDGRTLYTQPYQSYVPSFGLWGFIIAGHHQPDWSQLKLPDTINFRYLHPELLPSLITFAPDTAFVQTKVNSLQSHPLLQYYENESKRWFP